MPFTIFTNTGRVTHANGLGGVVLYRDVGLRHWWPSAQTGHKSTGSIALQPVILAVLHPSFLKIAMTQNPMPVLGKNQIVRLSRE